MMKTKIFKYSIVCLLLGGCVQTIDEPTPDIGRVPEPTQLASKGSLDFTRFVSIGNSLTAGFQAGALFTSAQDNSMAAIMAKSFDLVGGGSFNQPSINSTNGYLSSQTPGGTPVLGRLILSGDPPAPSPTISDAAAVPSPLNPSFFYSGDKSKLNNFAVPGIQLGQALIPETGDWTLFGLDPRVNPYYARFASNPGTSTIIGDALARQPTFFLFWLGANDVLGYAVGGASNEAIFTSEANFEFYYTSALGALTADPDVEGVVGNVPSVTAIPFFKLVPYNAIPLDQATAESLNTGLAAVNGAFDGLVTAGLISQADADVRKMSYSAGANPILMVDEDLNDLSDEFDILVAVMAMTPEQRAAVDPYVQSRPANSTDRVPLTAATVLGTSAGSATAIWGVSVPVGDQYILTQTELDVIEARIVAFNTSIQNVVTNINASRTRVALFDAYSQLNYLSSSPALFINNVIAQPTLAPPFGVFSEDGVHPNSRGYALAARWIIEEINRTFGSNIPLPSLADYSGTGLPQ